MERLLGTLPRLDGKRRDAFRSAYSDQQCDAWGIQTRAPRVLAEANRWILTMAPAVTAPDGVLGYSPLRLAWLCECALALQAEVAKASGLDADLLRSARGAAAKAALHTRNTLAHLLKQIAGGDKLLRKEVSSHLGSKVGAMRRLREGLPGLITLATSLRKDERLRLLADDVGLTPARLELARAELAALEDATNRAWALTPGGRDSPETNRVEGRVLRELAHAHRAFKHARAEGQVVPTLVPGPAIRAVFSRHHPQKERGANVTPLTVPVARDRRGLEPD